MGESKLGLRKEIIKLRIAAKHKQRERENIN